MMKRSAGVKEKKILLQVMYVLSFSLASFPLEENLMFVLRGWDADFFDKY